MDFFAPFTEAWNSIIGTVQNATSWLTGVDLSSVTDVGKGIASGLIQFGNLILQGIIAFVSYLGNILYTIYNKLSTIYEWLGSVFYSAISYFSSAFHKAISYFGKMMYGVGNWIYNTGSTIGMMFYNLIDSAINFIIDTINELRTKVQTSIDNMVDSFENHIIQFSNGIVDKLEKILTNHLIMEILEADVKKGKFGFNTFLKIGGSLFIAPILSSVLKGL